MDPVLVKVIQMHVCAQLEAAHAVCGGENARPWVCWDGLDLMNLFDFNEMGWEGSQAVGMLRWILHWVRDQNKAIAYLHKYKQRA